ncbi:ComF family protein [Kordiimonas sp. SCSIO 12610]|uniref:ComF family protein n=1 Tax=Kordiimonas sp. SCSIO 12610 TaxID=2829597 RepID=UPI00210A5174|nr:ComF family protein [Kordiimonas sp. SCSIO 12610]UTW55738.1 ComF family protein [Kordiimonas sp. SCSIO 12610]
MMRSYAQNIIDFVLPPRCPLCSVRVHVDGNFCGRCWSDLSLIIDPLCKSCGMPFDYEIEDNLICGECIKSTPSFDHALSVFRYEGKGRSLVLALKNNRSFVGFQALSKLMINTLFVPEDIDLVIPVPLHPLRLMRRRFNQSHLLADAYVNGCGHNLKVSSTVLVRQKNTVTQGSLNRKERHKNVRTAFTVKERQQAKIEGKRVLLVDDVYTTGATLNACAKTLKAHGAARVEALTLARVVGLNSYI